jgi:hypothetical protein
MFFYCLDHYYAQPCPLDAIGYVLVSPAYFFFPIFGESPVVVTLLPLNSFFWGCVMAEPFRYWCGWPPWRFSLRTLLVITTVIAVLLGISGYLKQNTKSRIPPVVQPANG